MQWYRVSKVKAEKACWKFVEDKDVSFDIVTINPPMIIGPWLPAYRRNNESSIILKEYLSGACASSEATGRARPFFARLHRPHALLPNRRAQGCAARRHWLD
jgi:nucleoside-diphosphate-sugar epimerase